MFHIQPPVAIELAVELIRHVGMLSYIMRCSLSSKKGIVGTVKSSLGCATKTPLCLVTACLLKVVYKQ